MQALRDKVKAEAAGLPYTTPPLSELKDMMGHSASSPSLYSPNPQVRAH
jgi:hypothetical protein